MKLPILQPQGDPIAWAIDHPEEVNAAVALINLLARMQVEIVTPDSGGGAPTLTISDTRALLTLPMKFQAPWAIPTGTPSRATFNASATTTASGTYQQTEAQAVATRLTETRQILAALILDLQRSGLAPTV